MEKKGELLNQIAIISDLIEKMNLKKISSTIVFELENDVFESTFKYVNKLQQNNMIKPNKTFTIKIGEVDIIFNKSSV
jgi:hypothetical protein